MDIKVTLALRIAWVCCSTMKAMVQGKTASDATDVAKNKQILSHH